MVADFFHTPSWSLRFQRYNLQRQPTTQQESWANQGQIRGKSGANQGRRLTLTLLHSFPHSLPLGLHPYINHPTPHTQLPQFPSTLLPNRQTLSILTLLFRSLRLQSFTLRPFCSRFSLSLYSHTFSLSSSTVPTLCPTLFVLQMRCSAFASFVALRGSVPAPVFNK